MFVDFMFLVKFNLSIDLSTKDKYKNEIMNNNYENEDNEK